MKALFVIIAMGFILLLAVNELNPTPVATYVEGKVTRYQHNYGDTKAWTIYGAEMP